MKKTFLLLSTAAALTLASCSQEKTTETAATTSDVTTTTTTANDTAYWTRADDLSQRTATDLNLTDTSVVSKVRTAYYNRARSLDEIRNRYTADTTGRAAELRSAYTSSDTEFQTILTDPNQYQSYADNRPNYYEEQDVVVLVPANRPRPLTAEQRIKRAAAGVAPGQTIKGADGSKISRDKDGDIKIKDAAGNKAKLAGDDGTVKLKPEDGKKVKIN